MIGSQNHDKVQQDIRDNKIKEGPLLKQSRHLKQWKQRWMVLTKTHLYSFQNRGVYKNPTQMIALKDIETTKAYYKDQYSKPFTFRVESKEVNLHMSSVSADQKWAWMTAIQKMVDRVVHPDTKPDTHNLIRETIRMSSAVRTSMMKKQQQGKRRNSNEDDIMKKIRVGLNSKIFEFNFKPNEDSRKSIVEETFFKVTKNEKNYSEGTTVKMDEKKEKVIQKIVEVPVQKIVYKEIKVPEIKQKVVERIVEKIVQKPVYIEKEIYIEKQSKTESHKSKESQVTDLIAHLLHSPHQNPRPILDFTIYLLTQGPEIYHPAVFQLCYKSTAKTLFSEYLILMINQQADELRLNIYLRFMILLYENTTAEYFYASDFKVFIDILLRQIEMNRSEFNQYLIMMVLKAMAQKDWWITYNYRRNDLKGIVKELYSVSGPENQFLAEELLSKI